jgi:polysaccharide export outer membrane protein
MLALAKIESDLSMFTRFKEGSPMKHLATILLAAAAASSISAQQPQQVPNQAGSASASLNFTSDLPIERIGSDDLVGITVYDSPELTRTVRVDSTGEIRLPMMRKPINAKGLFPADLEKSIASALVEEHVLVDPVVTVTVVEYRSRPISVVGAVRNPVTFQATGSMTLLDAISQAGGLTENAGPEILVSEKPTTSDPKDAALVRRIPVRGLINAADPTLNIALQGGEVVRVPEAGKFYVLGNVHKPGAFPMTDGSQSSVLKALALSEGQDQFTGHVAYVYRADGPEGGRHEIPIELKKIMDRKSPDVALLPNDILYIPQATGRKATLTALDRLTGIGATVGTTLLYIYH